MKRDWKEILTEAKAAGLFGAQVARAQGVSKAFVTQAQQRHKIFLVKARPGRPSKLYTDEFAKAAAALEPAASFCLRIGISSSKLHKLEAAHGVKLPRRGHRRIISSGRAA